MLISEIPVLAIKRRAIEENLKQNKDDIEALGEPRLYDAFTWRNSEEDAVFWLHVSQEEWEAALARYPEYFSKDELEELGLLVKDEPEEKYLIRYRTTGSPWNAHDVVTHEGLLKLVRSGAEVHIIEAVG